MPELVVALIWIAYVVTVSRHAAVTRRGETGPATRVTPEAP